MTQTGTERKAFKSCLVSVVFVLTLATVVIFVFFSETSIRDFRGLVVERQVMGVDEVPEAAVYTREDNGIMDKFPNLTVFAEEEPTPGNKHIIFLETRCLLRRPVSYNYTGLLLHARQACSLESAARTNPDHRVYLLYSCPVVDGLEDSAEYVQAALSYPNVRLWRIQIKRHFSKTPLEKWSFQRAIRSSYWPNEHASDVLRYLTLWKYGGTYMDLDVIVLKPIAVLGSNYVGLESEWSVASSVLNFAHDGIGHEVATMCVMELRDNFRGDIWVYNGPDLITRVLLRVCGVPEATTEQQVPDLSVENCQGFKVLSSQEFFPIPYQEWRIFFAESETERTLYRIQYSYGVHFWNKLSKVKNIRVGSDQPFSIMVEHGCPRLSRKVGNIM